MRRQARICRYQGRAADRDRRVTLSPQSRPKLHAPWFLRRVLVPTAHACWPGGTVRRTRTSEYTPPPRCREPQGVRYVDVIVDLRRQVAAGGANGVTGYIARVPGSEAERASALAGRGGPLATSQDQPVPLWLWLAPAVQWHGQGDPRLAQRCPPWSSLTPPHPLGMLLDASQTAASQYPRYLGQHASA